MTLPRPELSIVIPVYRSQAILPHLVERIGAAMDAANMTGRFELILVNDASPDGSWGAIREQCARHSFVQGIDLARNFGQHNATMAGLNHARGDVVVIMDDDLQHPPDSIMTLVEAVRGGADACYTVYENRQHSLGKRLGSRFNDWVATILLGKPRGLYLSSYKAICRRLVREIVSYDGPYAYLDGLILDRTRHIVSVPIQHQARHTGSGNYTLRRSLSLWLKMATSFSVLPLRLASVAGMVLAGISAVAMIAVIAEKILYPQTPAGWASVLTVVLFLGGLQLLCLGVIGEYIGRGYLKLNRKPQFAVRERVGNGVTNSDGE